MNTIIIVVIVVILIIIGYVLIDKCKCSKKNNNVSDMLEKENMNLMHKHNAYQDDQMSPYSLPGKVYDFGDMYEKENMSMMRNAYQDGDMGPYSLSGKVYNFSDMDILQNSSQMNDSALRSIFEHKIEDRVRPQDSDCSCYSGVNVQRKPCPPLHYYNYNTGDCEPIFQGDATPERIWSRKPYPEPVVTLPGSTLDEYGASLNVPREALVKIGKELVTLKTNQ